MKLNRKYTPGEWRAIPNTHHSSDTNPDTLIVQDSGNIGEPIGMVRAECGDIIAAAPDMVEALVYVLENHHEGEGEFENIVMSALRKAGVLE